VLLLLLENLIEDVKKSGGVIRLSIEVLVMAAVVVDMGVASHACFSQPVPRHYHFRCICDHSFSNRLYFISIQLI
jgi:hypothetical protein